jgi:RND family efflux transporter MFP subunit
MKTYFYCLSVLLWLVSFPGVTHARDILDITLEHDNGVDLWQDIVLSEEMPTELGTVSVLSKDNPYTWNQSTVDFGQLSAGEDMDCLVEPHMVVDVATAAAGIIESVSVDRGDFVEKGQVIARLESDIQKLDVELSRVRAEFSKRKYSRMERMHIQKVLSSQEKDESETEKELAALEFKRAREALEMREIRSPLSGVIVERYLSPGEFVEQEKLVKVAQIDPLNVEVIVPDTLLGKVQMGGKALIALERPTDKPLESEVKVIDKVVDAASGTFGIRLELPNPDYRIPAGVRCVVRFLE